MANGTFSCVNGCLMPSTGLPRDFGLIAGAVEKHVFKWTSMFKATRTEKAMDCPPLITSTPVLMHSLSLLGFHCICPQCWPQEISSHDIEVTGFLLVLSPHWLPDEIPSSCLHSLL
ncbi:uncharacterized protein LOC144601647 [Rhinoraja longicauda]